MIKTAEEVLENLRSGKTQALAIAEVFVGEEFPTGRSVIVGNFSDYPRMIGHLEWLKARVFSFWVGAANELRSSDRNSPAQSEGNSK